MKKEGKEKKEEIEKKEGIDNCRHSITDSRLNILANQIQTCICVCVCVCSVYVRVCSVRVSVCVQVDVAVCKIEACRKLRRQTKYSSP